MKAIVIHAARDLRVEEREAGAPGPGEVRLRLAVGGICGSDLHYYNHGGFGTVRLREPMILGHEVSARVEALVEERRKLERELSEARKKLALGGGSSADAPAQNETVAGVGFLGKAVTGVSPKDLKPLADAGKTSLGSGVVVFVGASEDNKASVVVGVTDDLTSRFSAVDLVRVASAALGGQGGGGRPDMAQAGGPDASKASQAIAAVRAALEAA